MGYMTDGLTFNVGDRVKWLPTGQEGRIFEVRDGGIVAVRGEGWAVYDYADRFERLVRAGDQAPEGSQERRETKRAPR